MNGPIIFRVGTGQGRIGWLRLLIIILMAAGVLFLAALLAFGLLIVLAPLMVLAGILSYLFPGLRRRARRTPSASDGDGDAIDVEYRVVEGGSGEEQRQDSNQPRLS